MNPSQSFFVSGAGEEIANGTYQVSGLHDGAPRFMNENGAALYRYRTKKTKHAYWFITKAYPGASDGDLYRTISSEDSTPPLGGWLDTESCGAGPSIRGRQAPTCIQELFPIQVLGAGEEIANGTYRLAGSHDGAPRFMNESGAALYRYRMTKTKSAYWFISKAYPGASDSDLYRTMNSDDSTPPLGGWLDVDSCGASPSIRGRQAPTCMQELHPIQVLGAGEEIANGTYRVAGSHDGAPRFMNEKGAALYRYRTKKTKHAYWFISKAYPGASDGDLYRTISSEDSTPPLGGWLDTESCGAGPSVRGRQAPTCMQELHPTQVVGAGSGGGALEGAIAQPTAEVTVAKAQEDAQKPMSSRRNNRWGEGIDAPAAGARQFMPSGWVPECDVVESLTKFGTSREAINNLREKAARKHQELKDLAVMAMTLPHLIAVMAYTEENDLHYPVLNRAMRTTGATSEARLKLFATYIYHLESALQALPTMIGTVYRGLSVRLAPETYARGNIVTWQAFSSATRCVLVTVPFLVLKVDGRMLSGTLFVITSSSGKDIAELSVFPAEEEVLFKANSFFRVVDKLGNEAEKLSAVPKLGGYCLESLDIYTLEQL